MIMLDQSFWSTTPTEIILEFLDCHRNSVMHSSKLYIKNSWKLRKGKNKKNSVTSNTVLITADVVGSYSSIPHDSWLNSFKKILDKKNKNLSTIDFIKMTGFVLWNDNFEFMVKWNRKYQKQQYEDNVPTHTYIDKFWNGFITVYQILE